MPSIDSPSPVSPPGKRPPQGPPLSARVSIQDRPVQGEPDAPVTLVEFLDYECPYCRRFFNSAYGRLKQQYIDPGQLRLVVKDMPPPFHKQARKAAKAAHCAGEQNSFWRMHDQLYGGQAGLNVGALLAYAERLDLDQEAFKTCLASDRHMEQIDADIAEATAVGIPGKPAFVLGRSGDNEVEGALIRGVLPFGVFQAHIDRLLGQGLDSRK